MSRDERYLGDLFVFPIREFAALISRAPLSGGKHKVYISRQKDSERWFLRCQTKFEAVTEESCAEVTSYYRAFNLLDRGA
jgi:hypothetical protein